MEYLAPVSGGLDSAIMYLFLTGYIPGGIRENVTGIFTDPHKEHPRTYAMLDTLEQMSGKKIVRLHGPSWEECLEYHKWFLPYHKARWCTRFLKIKPFETYIKGSRVTSHIGLRADEPERAGYLGDSGSTITPRYPLREMGVTRADVEALAAEIGLPPPAFWSCGCCPFKPMFYQVMMVETQPEMAEWMAWVEEEKQKRGAGGYTWCRGLSMRQLIDNPVIRMDIKRRWWTKNHSPEQGSFWDDLDEEDSPCLMCRVK